MPKLNTQWGFSGGLTVVGIEGERKYMDQRGHFVAAYELAESR